MEVSNPPSRLASTIIFPCLFPKWLLARSLMGPQCRNRVLFRLLSYRSGRARPLRDELFCSKPLPTELTLEYEPEREPPKVDQVAI